MKQCGEPRPVTSDELLAAARVRIAQGPARLEPAEPTATLIKTCAYALRWLPSKDPPGWRIDEGWRAAIGESQSI
jgi:hypothetical protein